MTIRDDLCNGGDGVPIFDHPLLDEMNADGRVTFYLTGSRYAGTATDASDWDFFVAESDTATIAEPLGMEKWLMDRGFTLIQDDQTAVDEEYADHPYTVGVYRNRHPAGKVEVQVVTDVEVARRTRDLVYGALRLDDDRLRREDKAQRGVVWCLAARTIMAAQPKKPVARGGIYGFPLTTEVL